MAIKELAPRVELLENEARKIDSLQNALNDAMFSAPCAATPYEWAFVALGDLTFALSKSLSKLKEELYAEAKKSAPDGNLEADN